jgi:hypothetical protein
MPRSPRAFLFVLPGLIVAGSMVLSVPGSALAQVRGAIPDAGLVWSGRDYEQLAAALEAGAMAPPYLREPRSAPLFRRIVSIENLAALQDRTVPVQRRFGEYLTIQGSANRILKRYLDETNRGQNAHEELAQLMALSLRISAVGVDLIEDFLPTVPKDEKYKVRMEGLQRVKLGVMTQFEGAEVSLAERHLYSPKDLSLILEAMSSTIPSLKRYFSPEFVRKLKPKLEADRRAFKDAKDRRKIDAMIADLGK